MGFYGSSLKGEALSLERRFEILMLDLRKLMKETNKSEKKDIKEDLEVDIRRLKDTITLIEKAIERE